MGIEMPRDDRDLTATPALSAAPLGTGLPRSSHGTDVRIRNWLLGIAICSLVPAAFWCGVIWLAAPYFGYHPSASGLAAIGSTIALFLTLVSSALLARV